MNAPAYILSHDTLTLYADGTTISVHNSHPEWPAILDDLRTGDWEALAEKARPKIAITRYLDGDEDFTVDDSSIQFRGDPVHPLITERLLQHMRNDLPTKPLANFARELADNPDYWVADQLYPFVEKGNLPLTEDGCFLAYKLVRDDYTDVHSGTVDYHVGNVVTMSRQKVDNDRNRTCSAGLHACSLDYLQHFSGDRLLAVKINPRDVVSVPADYNDTKLRCCRMEVVAELDRHLAAPAWDTPVFDYGSDEIDPEAKYFIKADDPIGERTVGWNRDTNSWSEDDYSAYYGDSGLAEALETARDFRQDWPTIDASVEDEHGNVVYD